MLVLAGGVGFAVYWWLTAPPVQLAVTAMPHTPNPANGETIFNAGGCSSCHAVPNQPDRTRLGGGWRIPSPFGTFYAPNISPDPDDGIGRWSEADFVKAVMQGSFAGAERTISRRFPIRPMRMPRATTCAISSPI